MYEVKRVEYGLKGCCCKKMYDAIERGFITTCIGTDTPTPPFEGVLLYEIGFNLDAEKAMVINGCPFCNTELEQKPVKV